MTFYWLSFCDPDRPTGQQFLGACIVQAPEFVLATIAARLHGCNPGGEVQGFEIPAELECRVPLDRINVLWTRAECEAFESVWAGTG